MITIGIRRRSIKDIMLNNTNSVGAHTYRPALPFIPLIFSVMIVASGCAGVSQQASLSAIQDEVEQRIDYTVLWNRSADTEKKVAQSIRRLLEEALTADAAVQIALLNNRRLQAVYEELGIGQAMVVDAGLATNPKFHGGATFGHSDDHGLASGGEYVLEVGMDFLSILHARMRTSVAETEYETAKLRVTATIMDLAAQTRLAYYRAQTAEQMLEMSRQIAEATKTGYEFTQRLFEAGNILELDLLLQQSLSGDAQLDLASAELEVAESREELNSLMGLWGENVSWSVASPLPDAPANPMKLEGLEKIAIENSIDLALARQKIIALGKQLGIAKATKLVPSLDLGMEIEQTAGDWATGPLIGFEIPIFDRNQGKIAAAKSELRRRQQEFHALGVDIRAAVRAARRRLTTARQTALFYQNEILPLRRKIVEQVQLQYNAMQVGTPRLLLAKQQQIEIARAYVQSLYNYHVAQVELDQILAGRLFEPALAAKFILPSANIKSLPGGSSEATLANGPGGH